MRPPSAIPRTEINGQSPPVNIVAADGEGEDDVALDEKHRAQITFDHHGMDRFLQRGGKPVDFMGAEPRVEGGFP